MVFFRSEKKKNIVVVETIMQEREESVRDDEKKKNIFDFLKGSYNISVSCQMFSFFPNRQEESKYERRVNNFVGTY